MLRSILAILIGSAAGLVLGRIFRPGSPAPAAVVQADPAPGAKAVASPQGLDLVPPGPAPLRKSTFLQELPAAAETAKPLWVAGRMHKGRKVWVYLSDGRVLDETTPGLQRVDTVGAVVDGVRIWMKPYTPQAVQIASIAIPGARDERSQPSSDRTDALTGRPGSAGDDLPES